MKQNGDPVNHAAHEFIDEEVRKLSCPDVGEELQMMPVMVCGLTVSGKIYGATAWLIAGAVMGSVSEFLMIGPTSSSNDSDSK